jgi:hypothetical protein
MTHLNLIDESCARLSAMMAELIRRIDEVPIGKAGHFPYGWRKAAKGRTVWRLLEEIISQNLEYHHRSLGMTHFKPSESEVGIYDFSFSYPESDEIFVNVKSAMAGRKRSKDDISKARSIAEFFSYRPNAILLVATVEINFQGESSEEKPLSIELRRAYIVPVMWLPDIYVNPSNNGNLQSSYYKDFSACVRRSNEDFITLLKEQIEIADEKRKAKQRAR